MISKMHGLIFAHQPTPGLRELVEKRTTSSIPYAGRYRLIDFPLSSMVNAGITDIGVIMQESYQSLIDHLGSGKDWDLARRVGGLRLLPPFSYSGESVKGYRGRMEALAGETAYLDGVRQEYVLFCEGSLVANIPYEDVLRSHIDSGAHITAVCSLTSGAPSPLDDYFVTDERGFVKSVVCRPFPEQTELCCRSLEAYIISAPLLRMLTDHCICHGLYSFTRDILMGLSDALKINTYIHEGYTAVMRTVSDYYRSSMELLDASVRRDLFRAERPIKTTGNASTSTYYAPDAVSSNSLVADGCRIEGEVTDSIVFRGVRIGRGAKVRNCILLQDTVISAGAELERVITDKNVFVAKNHNICSYAEAPMTIRKGLAV